MSTSTDEAGSTLATAVAPTSGSAPLAVSIETAFTPGGVAEDVQFARDFGDGSPRVGPADELPKAVHVYRTGTSQVTTTVSYFIQTLAPPPPPILS